MIIFHKKPYFSSFKIGICSCNSSFKRKKNGDKQGLRARERNQEINICTLVIY